jgi:hypothetical protein
MQRSGDAIASALLMIPMLALPVALLVGPWVLR